jgi:hypothetical protein
VKSYQTVSNTFLRKFQLPLTALEMTAGGQSPSHGQNLVSTLVLGLHLMKSGTRPGVENSIHQLPIVFSPPSGEVT